MDLSRIKLIATDMDGTLLNSKHEVSPWFYELFEQLKQMNVLFVAASGRPLYGITKKLSSIKNDILIIAENGGLAVHQNNVLLSTSIEKESLLTINRSIETIPEANVVYCTKEKAYTTSNSKELLNLLSEYYHNFECISSIEEIQTPIYKIALFHEVSSERYIYPYLQHLENQFKIKVSANHWVDISENNANKGHAIELIQQLYSISPEETMVFGDYNNDIEMLKKAYHSYAMENAHPLVKQTANFLTKDNNNFGVETILEKMIKAKVCNDS